MSKTLKLAKCTMVYVPDVRIIIIRDSDGKIYKTAIGCDMIPSLSADSSPIAQFDDTSVYLTWVAADKGINPRSIVLRIPEDCDELKEEPLDAPHVKETLLQLSCPKWNFGRETFIQSAKSTDLIFKCLGTPYGAYTKLDRFFLEPGVVQACSGIFGEPHSARIIDLTRKFLRRYNLNHCGAAEIKFNLTHGHISMANMTLEPVSQLGGAARFVGALDSGGYGFKLEHFHVVARGALSNAYVYLFRQAGSAPEHYEAVFDMREIVEKKRDELRKFFPEANPPKFCVQKDTQLLRLQIYKVRAQI
jgi:hypothetical protein